MYLFIKISCLDYFLIYADIIADDTVYKQLELSYKSVIYSIICIIFLLR